MLRKPERRNLPDRRKNSGLREIYLKDVGKGKTIPTRLYNRLLRARVGSIITFTKRNGVKVSIHKGTGMMLTYKSTRRKDDRI